MTTEDRDESPDGALSGAGEVVPGARRKPPRSGKEQRGRAENDGPPEAGEQALPDPAAWTIARALYEVQGLSQNRIAERLGVSRDTVRRRAKRGGWLARNAAQSLLDAGDPGETARMVSRLYRAFETEILRLERRLLAAPGGDAAEGQPADAAEAEKTARTLASLARTLDMLIALKNAQPQEQDEEARTADDLRQELQERLGRLGEGGNAGGVPGRPDSGGTGLPEDGLAGMGA